MNFIDAVIKISKIDDLELCDDETELNGIHSSICVYKDGSFIGKLRWPYEKDGKKYPAMVDSELEKIL